MKKLYVVTKYIIANSMNEALKIEKITKPEEIKLNDYYRHYNDAPKKSGDVGFKS